MLIKLGPPIWLDKKHNSHTHANVVVITNSVSHSVSIVSDFVNCGNPEEWTHRHNQTTNTTDPHTHSLTLSFGPANLGSPNWWEHTHPITLVSCGAGGSLHLHSVTLNSTLAGCPYLSCNFPTLNRHYHPTSGGSTGNTNSSHVHTLPASNTQNANPAGTPQSHVHPYSITLNPSGAHSHTYSGTYTAVTCYYGYSHKHLAGNSGKALDHTQTASGDSGLGGEEPPVTGFKHSRGFIF